MVRNAFACLTCDIEIWDERGVGQTREIVRLLDRHDTKVTFFTIVALGKWRFVEKSGLLSYADKHELGLHIHWGDGREQHSKRMGLSSLALPTLKTELEEDLERCRKLGFSPMSFRGGGLSQTTPVLDLLQKCGFRVDSSVAAGLNLRHEWFQGHQRVPYRSWYFPSKKSYDIPAQDPEDRMGILEIPVTRMIPSGGSWLPYTLTPTNPLFKLIVNEWLCKSRWENPMLITPMFHNWVEGVDFGTFLRRLDKMLDYLSAKRLEPMTLSEAYDLLKTRCAETYHCHHIQ